MEPDSAVWGCFVVDRDFVDSKGLEESLGFAVAVCRLIGVFVCALGHSSFQSVGSDSRGSVSSGYSGLAVLFEADHRAELMRDWGCVVVSWIVPCMDS